MLLNAAVPLRPQCPPSQPLEDPCPTAEKVVLVVDDSREARELLVDALMDLQGYTVYTSAHGRDALEILDMVEPDLVLLDVMMPGMDGFEVCRRIRALPRWQTVPIILVTALGDREARLKGLRCGADEFLTKPVDLTELQVRVQTAVALGHLRRQLQERERFEWVVMHSRDGYGWIDACGHLEGLNPTARRWLEMEELALPTECPWLSLIAERFAVVPATTWEELRDAGQAFTLTLIRPRQGATASFWIQVQGAPLPRGGWMLVFRDVTELQRTAGQMVTLVHLIAHKFRTPLTIVQGLIDLWEMGELHPGHPEWPLLHQELRANLNLLVEQVGHAVDLTQSWATTQTSAQLGSISARELETLFRTTAQAFLLPMERVTFQATADVRLPFSAAIWEVILYHLVDNAVKFHPSKQPQLWLKVVSGEGARGVAVSFEDDGPGIPPESREAVWRPLYQIDSDRAGQVPGLGIGLALISDLVFSIGGHCRIERGAAGGARIHLDLPTEWG